MFVFVWLSILLCSAQAEELLLRIAVDDRQVNRLTAPEIRAGDLRIPLSDDGEQTADLPDDGIFVGQSTLPRSESMSLVLWDDDKQIGAVEVSVPQLSEVTFQLKTTKTGLVLDLNAPIMPSAEETPYSKAEDVVLVQAKSIELSDVTDGMNRIVLSIDASETAVSKPVFLPLGADKPFLLRDDGQLEGDEKGDQIWWLRQDISPREFLEGSFYDGKTLLGKVKIALPSAQGAQAELQYNQFGLMVKKQNLQTAVVEGSLVVQAAPKGEAVSSSEDQIALTVYLDDRLLQKLQSPMLSVSEEGVDAVSFLDHGAGGDETAEDHLLIAKMLIARSEYAQIMISDQEKEQGTLRVFLPSTSEAVVWLRTAENGVKLISEPTPTKATVSPSGSGSGSASSVQMSADKLAHVLWVGIALFAIAFTYTRRVIYERWETEIRPVLHKLEQFVDAQEKKESENDTEP